MADLESILIRQESMDTYQVVLNLTDSQLELWHEPKPAARVKAILGVLTERNDIPVSYVGLTGALVPEWVRAVFPHALAEPVKVELGWHQ